MVKGMKRRDIETALRAQDCHVLRDRGDHTVWGCPCGRHQFPLPRHTVTSPGVVRKAIKMLACLPEGWLQ
jgi:hypothetical protein